MQVALLLCRNPDAVHYQNSEPLNGAITKSEFNLNNGQPNLHEKVNFDENTNEVSTHL